MRLQVQALLRAIVTAREGPERTVETGVSKVYMAFSNSKAVAQVTKAGARHLNATVIETETRIATTIGQLEGSSVTEVGNAGETNVTVVPAYEAGRADKLASPMTPLHPHRWPTHCRHHLQQLQVERTSCIRGPLQSIAIGPSMKSTPAAGGAMVVADRGALVESAATSETVDGKVTSVKRVAEEVERKSTMTREIASARLDAATTVTVSATGKATGKVSVRGEAEMMFHHHLHLRLKVRRPEATERQGKWTRIGVVALQAMGGMETCVPEDGEVKAVVEGTNTIEVEGAMVGTGSVDVVLEMRVPAQT